MSLVEDALKPGGGTGELQLGQVGAATPSPASATPELVRYSPGVSRAKLNIIVVQYNKLIVIISNLC
ncbi:hypothetical protein DC31_01725 [Microbacterium sp. CH12i]|nr:hypothetical protein DC31_01725 [Microbacterium sp. CH12i]